MTGLSSKACALAVLLGFVTDLGALRADVLTPDSIPSPPPVSPAVNGGSVPAGGLVFGQYNGKGLNFPYRMTGIDTGLATVITEVAGNKVWSGGNSVDAGFIRTVSFANGVNGQLVVPGTQTLAPTGTLGLKLIASGGSGVASALIETFNTQGNPVGVQRAAITEGPGGSWVTLNGAGITSFQITAYPGLIPSAAQDSPFIWGVAAVEFSSAPEPSGLTLAGVGFLGLVGWVRRRRPSAS